MKQKNETIEFARMLYMFGLYDERVILAAILIKEIRSEEKKGNLSKDEMYNVLLQKADELKIINPFDGKDTFDNIYTNIKNRIDIDSIDIGEVFAMMEKKSYKIMLPETLCDKYKEELTDDVETVFIAEGGKFAGCIKEIVDSNMDKKFTISSIVILDRLVISEIFKGYDNVEIVEDNIYDYEFTDKKYDLILALPRFRMKLEETENFICKESDTVAIENLLLHLNDNGELVTIIPRRLTFAPGKTKELRDMVQEQYQIKEMMLLPGGVFEMASIETNLLKFKNCKPNDERILARKYNIKNKRGRIVESIVVEKEANILLEELKEQGDWNIEIILAKEDEEWKEFNNSDVRKEKIGKVAELFRGKAVKRSDKVEKGNVGVINISNIGEYEIDYNNIDRIDAEERKILNYILEEGDIILPARGTAIRTAVFHEQEYPCIAHSNVIVIRPDKEVMNSTYLKVFLDSPIGNKKINSTQQGGALMNISYKDLKVLEVPVPDMNEQNDVTEKYNSELEKYKTAIELAEKRWESVLNELQKF